ncbi:MAG: oxygenase MpaB family protein, partial [Thioalkalivibrio sp.]|nr:oxygenase MpaB family protein [Thioalkalivibrio sp.]
PAMLPSVTLPLWYTYQRPGPALPLHLVGKRVEIQRRNAVRFMETFRWLGSVSAPGAGQLHTDAYSEDCRIRIIHGHIRPVVERKSSNWNYSPPLGWNFDALGVPFSVGDGSIVTTLLVLAISAMRKNFRLPISDRDMDALSQWACYVNYQQGVPDEFMFSTFDETMTYFAAFFLSVDPYVHNAECVGMINAVRHMHLERAMYPGSRVLQTVLDGILQASIDAMFGARVREAYDMPAPPAWSKPVYFLVRRGLAAVNTAGRYVPAVKRLLESRAEKTWTKVFPEAEKSVREHYGAVAQGTQLNSAA